MAISVDFACNDPDNGIYVGKFHMMQVRAGADDMDFDGPCYQSDGITFKIIETPIVGSISNQHLFAQVGRLKVPIYGYREWVGNWCWNSISVSWVEALKIINYIGKNKTGGWHMSNGPTDLFDAFNERHEITPLEWKANNEMRHKV